jgi:hypothetical protein
MTDAIRPPDRDRKAAPMPVTTALQLKDIQVLLGPERLAAGSRGFAERSYKKFERVAAAAYAHKQKTATKKRSRSR